MASLPATGPIPIILAGKTENIGAGVIAALKPEYEGGRKPGFQAEELEPLPVFSCFANGRFFG
jgi:hypothetical protein